MAIDWSTKLAAHLSLDAAATAAWGELLAQIGRGVQGAIERTLSRKLEPADYIEAYDGRGLETLREEISRRLGAGPEAGVWGTLPRQGEALRRAAEALRPLGEELPGELAAAGVRAALHALGEITGETATEELLERIFERFCVGK